MDRVQSTDDRASARLLKRVEQFRRYMKLAAAMVLTILMAMMMVVRMKLVSSSSWGSLAKRHHVGLALGWLVLVWLGLA